MSLFMRIWSRVKTWDENKRRTQRPLIRLSRPERVTRSKTRHQRRSATSRRCASLCRLLGQGFQHSCRVRATTRRYKDDMSDNELNEIIKWVASKNPQPCGCKPNPRNINPRSFRRPILPERVSAEQAIINSEKWLGDYRCYELDLWLVSPWRSSEDWRLGAVMLCTSPARVELFQSDCKSATGRSRPR